MALTRRLFFEMGSFAVGMLTGPGLGAQSKSLRSTRFERAESSEVYAYGVASGDPLADRVVLWTHVLDRGLASVSVYWQAAFDFNFHSVVSEGHCLAEESSDFTVKIDAKLPHAGTTYYYRFFAHGVWSTVGRTRSAPTDSSLIRFVVTSCSSIWSGYLNAYERISKRNDIDLVVHCGDYAYDVPDPDEQRNMPYRLINTLSPTSLADHRQRYRYYRSNSFLRAAHQQHPFAIIWDNHDIKTQAPVSESIQAFFEWQPVRQRTEDHDIAYRTLDYGALAKFILLDTRHVGRGSPMAGSSDLSILGDAQFEWLKDELSSSTAKWNIIVNQVLFVPFTLFDKPLNKDAWQGFPRDSERVRRFLLEENIPNTLIVSGDAHLSFASNVECDSQPVGVEFLPTSLSRGNLDETISGFLSGIVKGLVESTVRFFNPHIRYFETEKHGYGLVDLSHDRAQCEFWYVDHQERTQTEVCGRAFSVADSARSITNEHAAVSIVQSYGGHQAPTERRLFEKGLEIGGKGGDYFDGEERLHRDSRLTRILLRTDRQGLAKALLMGYADGSSWQMGRTDGQSNDQEWLLDDREYLRELHVGIQKIKGTVLVSYIALRSSDGLLIESGKKTRETMSFVAPEGQHIVSFHGRAGASIDKLGPIFAADF